MVYANRNMDVSSTESSGSNNSRGGSVDVGLAGGVTGGGTSSAAAGSGAGRNAVENNSLLAIVRGVKLIAEGCAKVAACRNEAIEKGLGFLVGVGATTTVLEKLSPSDQQYVLGVAMNGGRADAVAQLTPEQRAAYDYIVAQDKQGSFLLLPAQQSSSGDKPASTPNIGKDLSDADKAEIGGVGSGTGTPPPPENDSNQQNNKPTQNLNQK